MDASESHPQPALHSMGSASSLCHRHYAGGSGSRNQYKNVMLGFCSSHWAFAPLTYNKILLCFYDYSLF